MYTTHPAIKTTVDKCPPERASLPARVFLLGLVEVLTKPASRAHPLGYARPSLFPARKGSDSAFERLYLNEIAAFCQGQNSPGTNETQKNRAAPSSRSQCPTFHEDRSPPLPLPAAAPRPGSVCQNFLPSELRPRAGLKPTPTNELEIAFLATTIASGLHWFPRCLTSIFLT